MKQEIRIKKSQMKTIDSLRLAMYILAKFGSMNHLKIHKLIYYIEAYHLAYFGVSIIDDEFEAWVHGPVVTKLWHKFKDKANVYDGLVIRQKYKIPIIKELKEGLNRNQYEFINAVLTEFNKRTPYQLECLTHSEWPWVQARKGIKPHRPSSNKISKGIMKSYYKKKLFS